MRMSMARLDDIENIRQVANRALQSKSIAVERLNGYIFSTIRLQHPSDIFYIFRSNSTVDIPLLRLERDRLKLEADVLLALRGTSGILAPRLIEYVPTSSPYLISGPFRGSILSEIESTLSAAELAAIDSSLGHYISGLSRITNSSFGLIRADALSPTSTKWARCFAILVESLLRDSEDAMLSLPYDLIREQIRSHCDALDEITQPRLTLLEVASDRNIVVDPASWRVAGILDFSTAVWGDPYLSDCFYQPSRSFLEGFGRVPDRDANERTRQYLYITYHSLLAIVRHCYAPHEGRDELDARRSLTFALTQLLGIPV